MYLTCGYWDVETKTTKRAGHIYYVCRHRFNPVKVRLVFVKGDKLEGEKELCDFIKKEIIDNEGA